MSPPFELSVIGVSIEIVGVDDFVEFAVDDVVEIVDVAFFDR